MTKEKFHEFIMMCLLMIWAQVSPMVIPFILIIIMDVIDFRHGVRAARKLGKEFTMSEAYSRTNDKLTWQIGSMIVAKIFEQYILKNSVPVFQPVIVVILLIEGQSIREKVKILSGKDILKEPFNMIKRTRK